jgi:hypothetical protein
MSQKWGTKLPPSHKGRTNSTVRAPLKWGMLHLSLIKSLCLVIPSCHTRMNTTHSVKCYMMNYVMPSGLWGYFLTGQNSIQFQSYCIKPAAELEFGGVSTAHFLIRLTSVCLYEKDTFRVSIWIQKCHQGGCHSILCPCNGRQCCDLTFFLTLY